MRYLAGAILLLLLGVGPVWAGVVDDAEEVLQEVETDGPGTRALRSAPPGTSMDQSGTDSYSTASGGQRNTRGATRSGGDSSSGGAVGSQEEPDKDKDSPSRRRNRDSKQTARSFSGLLLLLGLVLAGAAAGRKLAASGGSED